MERRNYVPSVITQTGSNISPYVSSIGDAVGSYQYISALNNIKRKKVIGQFNANPVVMWKVNAMSKPGRTAPLTYGSNKNYVAEGDMSGYLAYTLGTTPSRLVQYYTMWDSAKANQAQNRAFASAAAPDLDIGVMLGEMRETLSGLLAPLSALRKFITQYNKLYKTRVPGVRMTDYQRSGNSASGLDMLSGSWLEWRYGVRPLLKSIEDIVEHVQAQNRVWSGKMLRKAGKVKTRREYTVSGGTYPGYLYIAGNCRFAVVQKYVSKLYFCEDAPLSWQHVYGIDLTNAPSVLWEIVPLSFIVDRFINVGDWLGALKFYSSRRTIKGMVTSCKTTIEGRTFLTEARFFNQKCGFVQDPDLTFKIEHLDRRIIPHPAVTWTPTVSKAHHSLSMLLDELTLTWQRMPKFRR